MSVFDFDDYKEFLRGQAKENQEARGYKSAMAAAAGCQRSVFSQVLGGKMELSRDHAAELSRFFALSPDEEEYFVLLVDLARAGSKRLVSLIRRRLGELKMKRVQPSARIAEGNILDAERRTLYYSSWYWSAIHILTSIPEYQIAADISRRLELPLGLVQKTLASLETMGLVKSSGRKWVATKKLIHLASDSPLNEINHSHWRLRAIQDIQRSGDESIHYSSVCALSRADYERLKGMLMEQVMKERELIVPSDEEELYCLSHDLFRI